MLESQRSRVSVAALWALVSASVLAQHEPVRFNRDIRPVLSDRCFKCHGFDEAQRQAGLRLDTREGLLGSRRGSAIVKPGDPDGSELIRRITSHDPDLRMPPQEAAVSLTSQEIDRLRRWVAEGAPYEDHWAFQTPKPQTLPVVADSAWVRTPIDQFVMETLEHAGLRPQSDADRETLCRRLHLDLLGLPPEPEVVERFLADPRDDAYERLVDQLLNDPRHGERMALMWLDVARYADTNGFHHDNIRTIWPYRDWVIRAFQRNLPYDQFVIEQLAGDLLPSPTVDQKIATAFCRMHNINDEGGALDEEYRVEAVADRIETVATAFLGLTFMCARCHDHKYDPITQDDYYSLYAYFNSVNERGVYGADFAAARAYPARIDFRPADLAERVAATQRSLEAAEALLLAASESVAAEVQTYEESLRKEASVRWDSAVPVEARSTHGATLEALADGSFRIGGKNPNQDRLIFRFRTPSVGLRLLCLEALADPSADGRVGRAENHNAVISAVNVFAAPLENPEARQPVAFQWAWADHEQPNGEFDVGNLLRGEGEGWALEGHGSKGSRTAVFLSDNPFGFPNGSEVTVEIACESRYDRHTLVRPRVRLGDVQGDIRSVFPVVAGGWWSSKSFPAPSFDDAFRTPYPPEQVRSLAEKRGEIGWKHRPDITDAAPVAFNGERRAVYFARTLRTPTPRTVTLSLGSDDGTKVFLDGVEVHQNPARRGVAKDQDQVSLALSPGEHLLVVKVINDGGPGGFYGAIVANPEDPGASNPAALLDPAWRDRDLSEAFVNEASVRRSRTFAERNGEVERLKAARQELDNQGVPVLVMEELPEPVSAFVLTRGRYDGADPNRPVTRRPPAVLGIPLPEGAPKNRLGLAQWLVQSEHPLTARVHVNRIWQMIFGAGLLETAENFGQQAAWPSHPQLLDWLAREFVSTGWDQRELIRLIVRSSVYRQDARRDPEALERDPQNRLLSSFPRIRLPGEFIRDTALFASGLLVPTVGGPSVRPYQPPGLWREVSIGGSSNTQVFQRDEGNSLYRRSLYTFWKRTSPNPQMATFDSPTREFCVVRRNVTNTPLQALVLWNDVQFFEASRVLAQRVLTKFPVETGSPDDQLTADRIDEMFRRCTGRRPSAEERNVLQETARALWLRYRASPDDAKDLRGVGEAPAPDDLDPAELATWTLLANAILSLDATIVRN